MNKFLHAPSPGPSTSFHDISKKQKRLWFLQNFHRRGNLLHTKRSYRQTNGHLNVKELRRSPTRNGDSLSGHFSLLPMVRQEAGAFSASRRRVWLDAGSRWGGGRGGGGAAAVFYWDAVVCLRHSQVDESEHGRHRDDRGHRQTHRFLIFVIYWVYSLSGRWRLEKVAEGCRLTSSWSKVNISLCVFLFPVSGSVFGNKRVHWTD